MNKSTKIILSVIAVLLILQFFRPQKNISAKPQPDDIFLAYNAPENVKGIIKAACYDCHSNNTKYPWYNNIQPLAWWLKHHVDEGKHELNFSEFNSYAAKKAAHKMEEAAEMVDEKEMPLQSYTIIHEDSRLTDDERKLLVNWFKEVQAKAKEKM